MARTRLSSTILKVSTFGSLALQSCAKTGTSVAEVWTRARVLRFMMVG